MSAHLNHDINDEGGIITTFAPGESVLLNGEVEAVVLQVCLSFRGLQYEVAWWSKDSRHSEWVNEREVSAMKDAESKTIGFAFKE